MSNHSSDDTIMQPHRAGKEKKIPAVGLFFVNPTEANYAMTKMSAAGGKTRFLFNSSLCIAADQTFFIAGPAVGAPMAVLCLEKLIVLGAKRVILVGWCGALQQTLRVGDVLVSGAALCGEGTSRYYSSDKEPEPSAELTAWLRVTLSRSAVNWQEGRVWSTDAPYRESRILLASLICDHDIAAVDMEYSALCTVALFRGIELAACMLVSDELWQDQWKAGFSNPAFRHRSQDLSMLFISAMSGLSKDS
jgi:uridine phosphorylase